MVDMFSIAQFQHAHKFSNPKTIEEVLISQARVRIEIFAVIRDVNADAIVV